MARASLDGVDAIDRGSGLGDHAAARLDDDLALGWELLAGGADQGVEVRRDGRWMVGVRIARAQPATEVIDRELAECSHRLDRCCERFDVEDL